MSYIEKIMSDIIQTISDIFWPPCNTLKDNPLQRAFLTWLFFCKTAPYTNPAFSQLLRQQTALRRAPGFYGFLPRAEFRNCTLRLKPQRQNIIFPTQSNAAAKRGTSRQHCCYIYVCMFSELAEQNLTLRQTNLFCGAPTQQPPPRAQEASRQEPRRQQSPWCGATAGQTSVPNHAPLPAL